MEQTIALLHQFRPTLAPLLVDALSPVPDRRPGDADVLGTSLMKAATHL